MSESNRHMDAALQDIELECAFAVFYFVGEPMAELSQHEASGEGVIGWARKHWPGIMSTMVEAVTHVVRGTLEQIDAGPVQLAAPLTPEEVTKALLALGPEEVAAVVEREGSRFDGWPPFDKPANLIESPRPQLIVNRGEWESPDLNTADGSSDFEVTP